MPRTKGSKNKNTNTAKNKNIININVNTATKKKRGRPSKTNDSSNNNNNKNTRNQQLVGGGLYNTRAPVFTAPPPPVPYISPPQPDQTNSLLSSFITSRLLNESTMTNRPSVSNMTNDEPSRRETLNFRESMIPKVEDTPIKSSVKPPPPPVTPKPEVTKPLPVATPIQVKTEVKPPTSTPAKTSELIVRPEPQSIIDFLGGTPRKTKSDYDVAKEAKTAKIRTLNTKPNKSLKETFEYNDLREELSGVPNPNKKIATDVIASAKLRNKVMPLYQMGKERYDSINKIKRAVKTKLAMNNLDEMKVNASIEKARQNDAATAIQKIARGKQARKEVSIEKQANELEKQKLAVNTLQAKIKRRNEQERVIKNAKQEIRDIENKKITRGTKQDKANRILTLNKGIEIIQNKIAVRPVGRPPRKSNAMSELEKQVSGQLLPA